MVQTDFRHRRPLGPYISSTFDDFKVCIMIVLTRLERVEFCFLNKQCNFQIIHNTSKQCIIMTHVTGRRTKQTSL